MTKRRFRLVASSALAVALAAAAIGAAVVLDGGGTTVGAAVGEAGELSPAMEKKLAHLATFGQRGGVSDFQEGEKTAADDEWMKHAIPGTDIPSAVIAQSSEDWKTMDSRSDWGDGQAQWKPLGPTWARSLPNAFRDRAVYTASTPDFSGRSVDVALDPNCGGDGDDDSSDDGDCRMWIANANGGVWRTDDALAKHPEWEYVSKKFEHNSVASLELDPNDRDYDTLWAGTGEPNACGSGCEAGVGVYKSTDGGDSWQGPFGREHFYNRAVGSLEVKPTDSKTIFAASGRAIRGLTSSCCGGVDALIPGAPHFGLFRSQDGGQSWQLVNQGADVLCTASTPDAVSLNQTACSPRGARRVRVDPVDPNTVYASFFARGIWRSKSNGDPGTWEQIMARVGPNPAFTTERAEFDVVKLPNGETRMYVGVGGGGVFARFRRNDNVRTAPAATVAASWIDLTSATPDTPGYSSFGYCDPQCSYDNYVFVPANHFPKSGADADTVYLSGDNEYNENNWGPASPRASQGNPATGRSNGRGVALTTNAGVHFTDLTDDTTDDFYPVELHPDHHALTVNPRNWKQFFDIGDGGVIRSNGKFVDDSGDCVQPKGYTGSALAFCKLVLSRVPERLETINKSLRTLHFYQLDYSPFDFQTVVGGTQDNGSWERGSAPDAGVQNSSTGPEGYAIDRFPTEKQCLGRGRGDDDDDDGNGNWGSNGEQVWVNINIADGGHNGFDLGDPCFRLSGWQLGQMMVAYEPKNQLDMNWIADTQFYPCPLFYSCEANAFIGVANDDNTVPHRLWSAREHVFRSDNQGRNPILTKETHREHCNVWYGDGDVDDNGQFEFTKDVCDDWRPLGDPSPFGRLTYGPAANCSQLPSFVGRPFVPCPPPYAYGADRSGGYVSVVEPAWDGATLWSATQFGRVFVSKNAGGPEEAVVFDRIDNDPTAANSPNRFVSAIYVDPKDPNHAWIAYSGFNAKDSNPGHVFEVRYVPGASTFRMLDGNEPRDRMGDIPATSIAVSDSGTIYVGTDYGCVASKGDGKWRECGTGLPKMPVADLIYVREQRQAPYKGKERLLAATHGQGVWELKTGHLDDDDDENDDD